MPTRKIYKKKCNTRKTNTRKLNRKKQNRRKVGGAPVAPMNSRINETNIEIIIKPDTSGMYNKQGSKSNTAYKTGDLVLNVRNKNNFGIKDKLLKQFNSVDSALADIANKCGDSFCLTHNNPPLIAKQLIKIQDDRTNVLNEQ